MTQFPLSVEVRFLRVPTVWRLVEYTSREGHVFVPNVSLSANRGRKLLNVMDEDVWELRNRFLRMEHTEDAALDFLGRVGIWQAGGGKSHRPETRLSGAFGYEWFDGFAWPLTLEDLWASQAYWTDLLRHRRRLAAKFKRVSESTRTVEKVRFALDSHFTNTLSIHLEMGTHPHAIIQPFTGQDALIASVWIDLIRGSETQVCQRTDCAIPFTGRKRDFCCWYCGHIVSVRRGREKKQRGPKAKKNARAAKT